MYASPTRAVSIRRPALVPTGSPRVTWAPSATAISSSGPQVGRAPAAGRGHGLRGGVARTACGRAEDLGDRGRGQALVVVEGEHELLALGHAVDGVGEDLPHLFDLVCGHRSVGGIGDGVAEAERLTAV